MTPYSALPATWSDHRIDLRLDEDAAADEAVIGIDETTNSLGIIFSSGVALTRSAWREPASLIDDLCRCAAPACEKL